jgi:serine/threonine-protein kinase
VEVAKQNYVAIDFYDGSIMYDFDTNTTTICDLYNAWKIALETK